MLYDVTCSVEDITSSEHVSQLRKKQQPLLENVAENNSPRYNFDEQEEKPEPPDIDKVRSDTGVKIEIILH